MVLKRKRNLKIDSNSVYSVFLLKDLDPDELEDYIENRDTGMEADEEKEIHLQNIIKGSESSIPLPVIEEIDNISRKYYKKIELNKEIEWKEDCKNKYIQTNEDQMIVEFKKEKSKSGIIDQRELNTVDDSKLFKGHSDPDDIKSIKSSSEIGDTLQTDLRDRKHHSEEFKSQIDENVTSSMPGLNSNGEMSFLSIVENSPNSVTQGEDLNNFIPTVNKEIENNLEPNNHLIDTNGSDNSTHNHLKPDTASHNKMYNFHTPKPSKEQNFIPPNFNLSSALAIAGENKSFMSGKCEELIAFCLRRVIIRYEKAGFETYTCFRDRIFHPTFKSRRNEALMIEKINRMGVEFSTLKQLSAFYKEKAINELQIMKQTVKIVQKVANLKLNKKQKKSVSKMLFEGLSRSTHAKSRLNLHSIMNDRDKIQNLRSFKTAADLFVDIKYYDVLMNLVKYKNPEDE